MMPAVFLMGAAAVLGAAGVAGAAYAAHGGDPRLVGLAAAMSLLHAPALLALSLGGRAGERWPFVSGLLLVLGVALFSGDLLARATTGERLFSAAAPAGGLLLIAGWLSLIPVAVLVGRRR